MNLFDLASSLRLDAETFISGANKAIRAIDGLERVADSVSNAVDKASRHFDDFGDALGQTGSQADKSVVAIERHIKALERNAMMAGLSKESQLELKRAFDISDFGNTEKDIQRINAAYDKMADVLEEDKIKAQELADSLRPTTLQEFEKRLDSIANTSLRLGAILTAAVTVPIVGLAKESLGLASSFQQAEIGFTTMLKSGEKAQTFLGELKDFAARTPFEFPDLLEASKRLLALGFAAEDTIPIMRSVGDAVAGLGGGSALIDRVTLALGQMRAKGKVSAEEMRQLAEAGIPAWEALANKIGVSVPEAMKMAQQGAIQAGTAIPAILEGMSERFGNLMENQMNTAAGQFSNFKDRITFILADIGKVLIPFANTVLQMSEPILEMLQGIAEAFANLPTPVQGVIVVVAALAAAAGPLLIAFAGVASSVSTVLPLIGSLTTAIGSAGGLSAVLTAATPLAIGFGAAIAGWALLTAINHMQQMVAELDRIEKKMKAAGPATQEQVLEIQVLEGAIRNYNKELGNQQIQMDSTGKTAREYLEELRKIASENDLFGRSTREARNEVKEAQKAFDEANAAFKNGTGNLRELSSAADRLRDAQKNLAQETSNARARMDDANKSVAETKAALAAAQKEFEKLQGQFQRGEVSYEKVALAQMRVDEATRAFTNATAAAQSILGTITGQSQKYSGSLADMAARMGQTVSSTVSLADTNKKLEAAVKQAKLEYQDALRRYDEGRGTLAQVEAAHKKLQETQDRADPDKAAQKIEKAIEKQKKAEEDNLKFYEQYTARMNEMNEQIAAGADKLAIEYGKSLEKLRAAAVKEVQITVDALDQLGQSTESWAVLIALKYHEDLRESYKKLGITSVEELRKTVEANRKAAEMIIEANGEGSVTALEAWIKYETSRQELARRSGEVVTEAEIEALERAQEELDRALGKQTNSWQDFMKQVSTIITDLGKDLAKAFIDFFKGIFGGDDFNDKIREQIEDLQEALQTQSEAMDQFRKENAEAEEEIRRENAERLAEETADLLESLEQRKDEYAEYAQEVSRRLEQLRGQEAERLFDELSRLAEALAEKEAAYEEYVAEVGDKEREIREKHRDELQEQLADLEDNLRDRTQAYDDFVEDANRRLSGIGADLEESISDDTRSANRKKEDENRRYTRRIENLNENLQEALAKGDQKRADSIRRQLRQEEEDHARTMRRIQEDLDEQISDAQSRAEEQTESLKVQLDRRTRDHQEFLAENAAARAEAVAEHAADQEKELADLQASLDKRTAALLDFRAKTAEKMAEAEAESAARLAREEEALTSSLDKRKGELTAYEQEVFTRLDEITAKYAAKQEEELAALQSSLAKKTAEYDKFRTDTIAAIEQLESDLKGPLDRIKELFGSVFESFANSILRVASEQVMGVLISKITGPLMDALGGLAGAVGKVFGGLAGGAASAAGTVAGGAASAVGGGASAAGGAAGSIAGAGISGVAGIVTGAVSAVSGVIGNFQMAGMNKSLDLIEKSTRYAEIHLFYILEGLNKYLPVLESLREYFWTVQTLSLNQIHDAVNGQIPDRIMQVHDLLIDVPALLTDIRDTMKSMPIVVPVTPESGGNTYYVTWSANDPRGYEGLVESIRSRGGRI